jgi:hypothetical protein
MIPTGIFKPVKPLRVDKCVSAGAALDLCIDRAAPRTLGRFITLARGELARGKSTQSLQSAGDKRAGAVANRTMPHLKI